MATDFTPLFPEESEETILARWRDWANETAVPGDDAYVDTDVGSMWWLTTLPGIRESARFYDLMGTETVAAAFPQFSWGEYLDDHAERVDRTRNEATAATGAALFTGPAATIISAGQTVLVPPADSESDTIEFQTTEGGTINAVLAAPSGLSATAQVGGTLTNGTTYRYVVTAVDDAGETLASAEVNAAATSTNKQMLLDWADVAGARSYLVYRKTGATGPPYDLLAQPTASTYTDTGAVAPNAAVHTPGANTTGGKLLLAIVASKTGSGSKVGAGAISDMTPPIVGVTVTNPAATIGGADTEDDESLRVRVEEEFGGAGGANQVYYRKVALDYPGVGRVTVIPRWAGTNTVLVIIADEDGQPLSAATVAAVQALFDPTAGLGSGDAPVGAEVTVQTSTALNITVTLTVEFEPGYSLDGDTGIAMRGRMQAAAKAYIESVPSGGEVVQRRVAGDIVKLTGVHDVAVTLSPGASGNGNIAVSSNPPKAPVLAVFTPTAGTV